MGERGRASEREREGRERERIDELCNSLKHMIVYVTVIVKVKVHVYD